MRQSGFETHIAFVAISAHQMTEQQRSSVILPSRRAGSGRAEPPALRELRREVRELRRGNSGSRRRERARRRRRILVLAGGAVIVLALTLPGLLGSARSFALPSRAALAGLSLRQRIVAIAESQVGYATHPSDSYCNKFSAYWRAGSPNCPSGETSEEWCADFAAFAWRKAGIRLAYGYGNGELSGRAASFYSWGIEHGTWHPASSGYTPRAGDVAVYGLNLGGFHSAVHVAIVTGYSPGRAGPDVINGDGDRTGFSAVERATDQSGVGARRHTRALLAGYVSP